MNDTTTDPHAEYARQIERVMAGLAEGPVILSPRDWDLLERWHERGVPASLVIEILRDRFEDASAGGTSPRLARIADALEEAWKVVLDGRRRVTSDTTQADAEPGEREAWREAATRLHADGEAALADWVRAAVARLARGADPAAIDGELDARILELASPGMRQLAESESREAIRRRRNRMADDVFDDTLRRATARRLRVAAGLPRLASTGEEK